MNASAFKVDVLQLLLFYSTSPIQCPTLGLCDAAFEKCLDHNFALSSPILKTPSCSETANKYPSCVYIDPLTIPLPNPLSDITPCMTCNSGCRGSKSGGRGEKWVVWSNEAIWPTRGWEVNVRPMDRGMMEMNV